LVFFGSRSLVEHTTMQKNSVCHNKASSSPKCQHGIGGGTLMWEDGNLNIVCERLKLPSTPVIMGSCTHKEEGGDLRMGKAMLKPLEGTSPVIRAKCLGLLPLPSASCICSYLGPHMRIVPGCGDVCEGVWQESFCLPRPLMI
jgi:hypothetical protein